MGFMNNVKMLINIVVWILMIWITFQVINFLRQPGDLFQRLGNLFDNFSKMLDKIYSEGGILSTIYNMLNKLFDPNSQTEEKNDYGIKKK